MALQWYNSLNVLNGSRAVGSSRERDVGGKSTVAEAYAQLSLFTTDKRCFACGKEKPLADFYRHPSMTSGYLNKCKECTRADVRNNRKERGTIIRAKDRARGRTEKRLALNRKRNALRNRLKEVRASKREWAKRHPETAVANMHARRARLKAVGGRYSVSQWNALKAAYNYQCLRCGVHEGDAKITVDHVLPLTMGGDNSIANLQPLCLACNQRKHARHVDYRYTPFAAICRALARARTEVPFD